VEQILLVEFILNLKEQMERVDYFFFVMDSKKAKLLPRDFYSQKLETLEL